MARSTLEERSGDNVAGKPEDEDELLEAHIEESRQARDRSRENDEELARERGAQVVEHVTKRLAFRNASVGSTPVRELGVPPTPRHAALINAARTVRKKMRGVRHTNPLALQAAVREMCEAEYGAITGAACSETNPLFRINFDTSPQDETAWKVYSALRKAIGEARAFSFAWEGRTSGVAAEALHVLRGLLPVLEAPLDDRRTLRPAFVQRMDLLFREHMGRTLEDREMAILSLLRGFCPRETYKTLLRGETNGLTASDVIDRETKHVVRARKGRVPNFPT